MIQPKKRLIFPGLAQWLALATGLALWAGPLRMCAQTPSVQVPGDTVVVLSADTRQGDIIDYAQRWFPWLRVKDRDTTLMPTGRVFAWILPSVGYEPQTKLAAYVGGNIAFRSAGANVSSIYPTLAYTQNHQMVFHTASTVWLPRNRLNLTTDWRVMYYPQLSYGLGDRTTTRNALLLSYNYLRLYQTLSFPVGHRTYLGAGYSLDQHWAIRASQPTGDAIPTGGYSLTDLTQSVSAGFTLTLLYDGRTNLLNPGAGSYANVQWRANRREVGSDTDYQAMLIDLRHYLNWPANSPNILALWSYNLLILSGVPPYLDLPTTGWDANNNMGRGYIQGRFRGRQLLYAETEYRFRLVANGVLGGVAFANLHATTEPVTNQFARLAPAAGAGLRLKLNKQSGVNLAIDYGVGTGGSRSVYFNIGELF